MKRILVALTAVALFVFPLTGFGMDFSEIKYGINAGVMLPQGDLDDMGLDMGYVIGGQAMMPSGVMDEMLIGLCLSAGMASGEQDSNNGWASYEADYDFKVFEVLPTVRFEFPLDAADMKVFGQAGIGFAWGEVEVDVDGYGSESEDDTEFGFAVGGGLAFMENFEATALYKSFDDADYVTITVGYNF
jgi:opacity protein-like surface antigen